MSIKIVVEKIVNDRLELKYRVNDIQALDERKLPEYYLNSFPHCFVDYRTYGKALKIYGEDHTDRYELKTTYEYSTQEIHVMLKIIEKCGQILRNINLNKKALQEDWNGIVEFII